MNKSPERIAAEAQVHAQYVKAEALRKEADALKVKADMARSSYGMAYEWYIEAKKALDVAQNATKSTNSAKLAAAIQAAQQEFANAKRNAQAVKAAEDKAWGEWNRKDAEARTAEADLPYFGGGHSD